VRTARVVLERAQNTAGQLTLPAVSDALKQKLEDLKPALAGKPLKVCG